MVKPWSGGLGQINAKTAQRALQILLRGSSASTAMPGGNGENNLRMEPVIIAARYSLAADGRYRMSSGDETVCPTMRSHVFALVEQAVPPAGTAYPKIR